MKLVQLARPLFLVALGLHALVLFLPTGNESEAVVVDDMTFSEETDALTFPSKSPKGTLGSNSVNNSLDRLPVADPNALAASSQKAASKPTTLFPAAVATRTAPTRATATQPVAPRLGPSTAGSTNGGPNPSVSNPESPSDNPQTNDTQTTRPSTADVSRASRPPTNNIPDLSDSSIGQPSTEAGSEALPSIEKLIAKLTESESDLALLLSQVKNISKSLSYSEKDTDKSSADQNRADWQADIQRQANIGTVESIAPTEISDLTEISYPIESPKQADMKARSLSLCLEKEPHHAEVGVLFDSQGNVANKPALIRSTGYGALNDEIIATVLGYKDFPPDRNSKAYLLEFEIDYNAETCVSLEELKE